MTLIAVIASISVIFSAKKEKAVDDDEALMKAQVAEIFSGERDMSIKISMAWGKEAHDVTNLIRGERNLQPLEWSNSMHTVAY